MNGKVKIRLVDTFVKHSTENPEMTFVCPVYQVYQAYGAISPSGIWLYLEITGGATVLSWEHTRGNC